MSRYRIGDDTQELTVQRQGTLDSGEVALRVELQGQPQTLWARRERDGRLRLRFEDGRIERVSVSRAGEQRFVSAQGELWVAQSVRKGKGQSDSGGSLEAPMPGKVTKVLVAVGDRVTKGQVLLTVEAMKMEHALKAPKAGVVTAIAAEVGDLVQPGVALASLSEEAPA